MPKPPMPSLCGQDAELQASARVEPNSEKSDMSLPYIDNIDNELAGMHPTLCSELGRVRPSDQFVVLLRALAKEHHRQLDLLREQTSQTRGCSDRSESVNGPEHTPFPEKKTCSAVGSHVDGDQAGMPPQASGDETPLGLPNKILDVRESGVRPSEIMQEVSERTSAAVGWLTDDQDKRPATHVDKFLVKFDMLMGLLILLNCLLAFIENEYQGQQLAADLGFPYHGWTYGWDVSTRTFRVLEITFIVIFVSELLFRLALRRTMFFYDALHGGVQTDNLFDSLIVIMAALAVYLPNGPEGTDTLRLTRIFRLARYVRIIRVMHLFAQLRVLIKAIQGGIASMLWSSLLLGVCMLLGSMLLCRMLHPHISGSDLPYSERQWLFKYYGTSSRAFYTLFEITLAGCWPSYARPLIEDVNAGFAIFFFIYVFCVVFGLTKVVTALYLKDTMAAAANDADMVIQERLTHRKRYIQHLTDLFVATDSNGDGTISIEEFRALLHVPKVQMWLQHLDLEIHEVVALFQLLDDGDGCVTYEEFIKGIIRVKGFARSMDVVLLGKDFERIKNSILQVQNTCLRIEGELFSTSEMCA